ncbi:hypothetical protein Cgig2_016880 [Carnegiea gigantea]|uniref:Uncharacterized protein n=1 Tax=Carnegiea gigantea TaxID=171969 RepID=A0A9Q1K5Q4_9CARY|nr:hypothetical protein Cgig2_016880 [Carnegiea gigantea]
MKGRYESSPWYASLIVRGPRIKGPSRLLSGHFHRHFGFFFFTGTRRKSLGRPEESGGILEHGGSERITIGALSELGFFSELRCMSLLLSVCDAHIQLIAVLEKPWVASQKMGEFDVPSLSSSQGSGDLGFCRQWRSIDVTRSVSGLRRMSLNLLLESIRSPFLRTPTGTAEGFAENIKRCPVKSPNICGLQLKQ